MRAFPAILVSTLLLLAGCRRDTDTATPARDQAVRVTDLLARGEYLLKIGGCNDCHTRVMVPAAATFPRRNG